MVMVTCDSSSHVTLLFRGWHGRFCRGPSNRRCMLIIDTATLMIVKDWHDALGRVGNHAASQGLMIQKRWSGSGSGVVALWIVIICSCRHRLLCRWSSRCEIIVMIVIVMIVVFLAIACGFVASLSSVWGSWVRLLTTVSVRLMLSCQCAVSV